MEIEASSAIQRKVQMCVCECVYEKVNTEEERLDRECIFMHKKTLSFT